MYSARNIKPFLRAANPLENRIKRDLAQWIALMDEADAEAEQQSAKCIGHSHDSSEDQSFWAGEASLYSGADSARAAAGSAPEPLLPPPPPLDKRSLKLRAQELEVRATLTKATSANAAIVLRSYMYFFITNVGIVFKKSRSLSMHHTILSPTCRTASWPRKGQAGDPTAP